MFGTKRAYAGTRAGAKALIVVQREGENPDGTSKPPWSYAFPSRCPVLTRCMLLLLMYDATEWPCDARGYAGGSECTARLGTAMP
eukprot:1733843-Rhodomonas_salina.1